MKICIVAPYFTPFVRGNEYGLAEALNRLGNDVTIITSRSKAPREKELFKGKKSRDLPFEVRYLRTPADIFENPVVVRTFREILRGYNLVMLQEDYPLICHKAFIAAKLKGITSVLSSERTYIPENRFKRCGLNLFDSSFGKVIREKVDLYTAHCSAAKKFLKEVVGVSREIEVIHVGIDNEIFHPTEPAVPHSGSGSEDIKILCVARLTKHKGLRYLIEAVKTVSVELNVGLYIMGRGEDYFSLKNLAERLEISRYVNFLTEPVPNEDMPTIYSSCDIYSQPSVIEPYGIAVLEAMACGKPVIGTNVGGMLDTIIHGKTGFRAQPENSEEIAEYIMLLADDRLRRKFGRNARRRAEKFDWIKIGKKYLKLVGALKKEI